MGDDRPAEPELPDEGEGLEPVPESEIAAMVAKAREWLADPALLENDLDVDLLTGYQINQRTAVRPPKGAEGLRIQLQAVRDGREMAAVILEGLDRRRREDDGSDDSVEAARGAAKPATKRKGRS
jgi:hypothetical protein